MMKLQNDTTCRVGYSHWDCHSILGTEPMHTLASSLPIKAARLALSIALSMYSLHTHADSWLSIGKTPASEGDAISLAIATKTSETFGWGLGILFNSDLAGDEVLDYPVPHNDYSDLGSQRDGNSIGLDAYWFPLGEQPWRPYAGVGLYYDQRARIAQSNATGWYYTEEEESQVRGGFEIGLQYRAPGGALFGLGYHNLRGGFVSLGW